MLVRVLQLTVSISLLIFSAAAVVWADDLVSARGSGPTEFCKSFDADRQTTTKIETTALLLVPEEGETRVDGGVDLILYSTECNSRDHFSVVDVGNVVDRRSKRSLATVMGRHAASKTYKIRFSGSLTTTLFPAFGELGWSGGLVTIDRIYELTESRDAAEPDFAAPYPRLSMGRELRELTATSAFALFGRGMEPAYLKPMLTPDATITLFGKVLKPEEIDQLRQDPVVGSLGLRVMDVHRSGSVWTFSGVVEVEPLPNIEKPAKTARYSYCIAFSVEDGVTSITEIKVSSDPMVECNR